MPKKPKGFCDQTPCAFGGFGIFVVAEMPKKPKGFCDFHSHYNVRNVVFFGRNAKEAERLL